MKMLFFSVVGVLIGVFAAGTPAGAQNIVWVANNGSDSNACTSALPCLTFGTAIPKAGSGGEVHCITPGTYSTTGLDITSPITIDCPGGVVTGHVDGDGDTIDIATTGIVNLRGLSVSAGTSGAVLGIDVFNATNGNVTLDNVNVSGYSDEGLIVGIGTVSVTNSLFHNNGVGIIVASLAGTALASLSHVTVQNNTVGIEIDGNTESEVNLTDSVVTSNTGDGVLVGTNGSARQFLTVQRSSIVMNGMNGIETDGKEPFLLIGESTIAWNAKNGISVDPASLVFSYRNNQINGNGTSGTGTDIGGTANTAGLQ